MINLKIRPRIKVIKPINRKVFNSNLVGLNQKEIKREAPTTESNDIKAKTDDKKENRYKDNRAEIIIPNKVKNLAFLTRRFPVLFLKPAINVPKAKALESIVPIKAAIKEIDKREANHVGKTLKTPLVNKLEGSETTPPNLKLTPK